MQSEQRELPAELFIEDFDQGPVTIDAYLAENGMLTIGLTEKGWLQMSPLVAQQLIERLRAAVGEAIAALQERASQ